MENRLSYRFELANLCFLSMACGGCLTFCFAVGWLWVVPLALGFVCAAIQFSLLIACDNGSEPKEEGKDGTPQS